MWKNYLKIAWRNLRRHRFYTFLNIFGLSLGLVSCLLISLYVINELGYDRFFENAGRIYRVDARIKFGDKEMDMAAVAAPLAFILQEDYPQVEAVTRLLQREGGYLGGYFVRRTDETENQKEDHVVFADSTFFQVFSVSVLDGDPSKALAEPHAVVLTSQAATKYFGSENALDKTLLIDNKTVYRVTAVIEDIPAQSHLAGLNMFFSMASRPESREDDWATHKYHTYLLLSEGVDAVEFQENLETVIEKYSTVALYRDYGITVDQFKQSGNYLHYSLFPLTSIHLHSDKTDEIGINGDFRHVYIFSMVALFLLVIACVNFMNLSTARSSNRAREVGVRKTLGSVRASLIHQFLTESILLGFISLGFAVVIAVTVLPFFNDLAARQITLPYQNPIFWGSFVLTGLLVGLLAGSYPAFFLSGFQTLTVLKGGTVVTDKRFSLRNVLVVFQFMVSVMLIAGTGIIFNQLNYIQNKPLGFDKDQVLIISDTYGLGSQASAFKQEVLRLPQVESVTLSGYLPTPSDRRYDAFFPEGSTVENQGINMQSWWVDVDYIPTLGLQIMEGRDFSVDFPTDSSGVILNEAAVRLFGYDDPIGKEIQGYVDNFNEKQSFTILGVIRDFHFESLRESIRPLALNLRSHAGATAVRLKGGGDTPHTLQGIETLWKQMVPGQPFHYHFMDEDFDKVYSAEQRVGNVFVTFALLSILIACLGLFGLAAFTAERRTKEIGVRKVLGASVANIVQMLSIDFVKLVLVAILFASPIAWWAMNKWLEDFAYRIDIGWWVFGLAGLIAVVIALLTVSFQAIRAAVTNPVESLRSE